MNRSISDGGCLSEWPLPAGTICGGHGECINEQCVCSWSWDYSRDMFGYHDCIVPLSFINIVWMITAILNVFILIITIYKLILIIRTWWKQQLEEQYHIAQEQQQKQQMMQIKTNTNTQKGNKYLQPHRSGTIISVKIHTIAAAHSHSDSTLVATSQVAEWAKDADAEAQPWSTPITPKSKHQYHEQSSQHPNREPITAAAAAAAASGTRCFQSGTSTSALSSSPRTSPLFFTRPPIHLHHSHIFWMHFPKLLNIPSVSQLLLVLIGIIGAIVAFILMVDSGESPHWGLPIRTRYFLYDIHITCAIMWYATILCIYMLKLLNNWALLQSKISIMYAASAENRTAIQQRQHHLIRITRFLVWGIVMGFAIPTIIITASLNLSSSAINSTAHHVFGLYWLAASNMVTISILSVYYRFCSQTVAVLRSSLLDLPDDVITPLERQQRTDVIANLHRSMRLSVLIAVQTCVGATALLLLSIWMPFLLHHILPLLAVSMASIILATLRSIGHQSRVAVAPAWTRTDE